MNRETQPDVIRYDRAGDGIVTLTLDNPGRSANMMNTAFRTSLEHCIDRLEAERDTIKGVIVTSAKETFLAGGDLSAILALAPGDAAESFRRAEDTKALLRRLELLGRPVAAVINGTALGGGMELCLACHARFCVDAKGVRLGLPETTLGLIPAAGGIVRLVRMIGLQAAVPLIVEGKTMAPAKALSLGLLTDTARGTDTALQMARDWIGSDPELAKPWDRKGYSLPGSTEAYVADSLYLRTAPTLLMKKSRGRYPAQEAAMRAAIEGASVDFASASRIESRHFAAVATGPVAKNMITTLFFHMQEANSGKARPEGIAPRRVSRLGVLGAGMMGRGIALAAASRGIDSVLKDVTTEAATKGKDQLRAQLDTQIDRGRMSRDRADAALDRITPTGAATDLAGCELIIEAVFEDRALKSTVTREAEPMLAPGGILASNTSTLPITGLAEAATRPDAFIGLHFFSPVDRMPLVEIIKGRETSAETLAGALDFVQQIGKTPIVVNDSRGFFTSRVFGTYTREGAQMVEDGVSPAVVENVAADAGLPVGPLTVLDQVSLILTNSARQQALRDAEAEGKTLPPAAGYDIVAKMVELGRKGRAAGGGFYDYGADGTKTFWPGLATHFNAGDTQIDTRDVEDRLLYIQAIEAIRIFEEGVVETVRDANVGSILGIGYPRWTGGVLQFVNMVGTAEFAARADALADTYGERFRPPALLRDKAVRNEAFI
ncbi:short chain enoyl-CoA hydratase /3-hydroxyacyl-CoA dehydrogenase [Salipiger thiooxidans]|uniref:Short chain enoyl-CoA hydratase /3-hydroxyacyl-CoA dehydrogenase n=1 Tax=Salipiger thiooxidans TaxID=282683 RepID=A0A1G7LJD3_9RHOB|nr:3-hydroxyacyl-CoA dehydrogenase NAD-binding domain-containing protein [Salipiger thiooxidans]SDF49642.1 short chain enoyl-CoA hydratase /3-hydroxyacyl-CoA dehydrogenase [Salipiger thiooxidans]